MTYRGRACPALPAGAIDHSNLDEQRPLRLEDPYPIAAGERALETGVGFRLLRRGGDRGVFPLELVYDVIPNAQLGLGTVLSTAPREIRRADQIRRPPAERALQLQPGNTLAPRVRGQADSQPADRGRLVGRRRVHRAVFPAKREQHRRRGGWISTPVDATLRARSWDGHRIRGPGRPREVLLHDRNVRRLLGRCKRCCSWSSWRWSPLASAVPRSAAFPRPATRNRARSTSSSRTDPRRVPSASCPPSCPPLSCSDRHDKSPPGPPPRAGDPGRISVVDRMGGECRGIPMARN